MNGRPTGQTLMQGCFRGHLDTRQPAAPAAIRVEERRISWPGGELAWQAGDSVSWAHQGGRFCVCAGRPHFPAAVPGGNAAARWLALQAADAAPQEVGGGWAVAIVAPGEGRLFLAVDRFAIQTACHATEGSRIAFAERADEVPALERRLDHQSLYHYLHFHTIPAPRTVFAAVRRLPAAHCLTAAPGRHDERAYWQACFDEDQRRGFALLRDEFLYLLGEAVRREAAVGRPGAFLSGGTDSSTVAGMLGRVAAAPDTYSIGFEAAGYDEMAYARLAARHFGTRHHEYYVTPDDLLWGIPAVARHHDQPFGNSSAVPAYFCARLAQADGITHMLAGDGGDELFGGNSRYATQRLFDLYRHIPAGVRRHLLEPLVADAAWTRRVPLLKQAGGYCRYSRLPMPERMESFNLIERLGPQEILTADFLAGIDCEAPQQQRRETWNRCQAASLINRMLAYDWKFTLADSDLPKVRGAARMAGVSVGFPLLDGALADFSLRLDPEWKLRRFKLRWFFKEALQGFLPPAIIAKKKHGFGLPFGPWALRHAGLRRLAEDSLDALVERGLLRGDFARRLLARHLPEQPGYYGEMVWVLMMLEQWLAGNAPLSRAE